MLIMLTLSSFIWTWFLGGIIYIVTLIPPKFLFKLNGLPLNRNPLKTNQEELYKRRSKCQIPVQVGISTPEVCGWCRKIKIVKLQTENPDVSDIDDCEVQLGPDNSICVSTTITVSQSVKSSLALLVGLTE